MNDRIYSMLNESASNASSTSSTYINNPDQNASLGFRTAIEEETQELRSEELTAGFKLTAKQASMREKLVAALLENGKRYLELKERTVEGAIRLFDLYCARMAEGVIMGEGGQVGTTERGRNVLEKKDEAQLAIVACLFSFCKYHEIYPPAISDILFIFGDRFTKGDVIRKENEVLHITGFGYEVSCISKWYDHYFTDPIPTWAYDCYLKCYGRMEELARVIHELARAEGAIAATLATRVGIAQKVVLLLNKEDKSGHGRNDKASK